jgi:hypothetical protein
MVVLVVSVIGLVVLRGRCDDSKGLVEFPYVVRIAPQNVLFVDGHEFHGEVVCTWEPGDSLRIEGIPVLPRRVVRGEPTEDELRQEFGRIPFVLECVDGGMSWGEAVRENKLRQQYSGNRFIVERVSEGMSWDESVDEYYAGIEETGDSANRAYWKVLEATGSKEMAAQAALDSLDRRLLDPSFEPRVSTGGMVMRFLGQQEYSMAFTDKPPWEIPTLEEIQRVTHEKASDFMRRVARHVGETRTACLEIPTAGRTAFGRDVVRRASRQIEEAEKGNMVEGPLPEEELKLILMVRGVKVDGVDD